ncbi:hypothetical protein F8388_001608 [Cannabis sativa]|uniref:Uncharacterized protein n=1 Tax=Cannabis sativa TaxID=3483 RepID=A0A7J6HJS8_CANSA|nr:hypothetical protein F8388_001608 [Cannabis sativa]
MIDKLAKLKKTHLKEMQRFVVIGGTLYYRSSDGVLARCLDQEEISTQMEEIHNAACGVEELIHERREKAQNNLLQYQRRVSRAYDKLVRPRTFQEGDMVLKAADHVIRGMHATKSLRASRRGAALKTHDTIFSNSLTTKRNMSLKLHWKRPLKKDAKYLSIELKDRWEKLASTVHEYFDQCLWHAFVMHEAHMMTNELNLFLLMLLSLHYALNLHA